MNQLVHNFKKKLTVRGTAQWPHKLRAIAEVAECFRAAFAADAVARVTFVPIPPSRRRDDPLYDDRVLQTLRQMTSPYPEADVRELIFQTEGLPPFHEGTRLAPEDLARYYAVDEVLAASRPAREYVFIVDDVLTTGSHFKAMQTILRPRFPRSNIRGLFIARRIFPQGAEDFVDLDAV